MKTRRPGLFLSAQINHWIMASPGYRLTSDQTSSFSKGNSPKFMTTGDDDLAGPS